MSDQVYRFVGALLFLLIQSPSVSATHIVGGEMTYRCLGNDEYELILNVYRDCYNGIPWFDDPASVAIYDRNWRLVSHLQLPLNRALNDTLSVKLDNPCLSLPPNVCVHRTQYTAKVKLPFVEGGYTAVHQRCCRNRLIRNLPDPLNTGISITMQLTEAALTACNSSPTFVNWPPVAICVNEPLRFDHSARDADGDSLVYSMCTPLNGPDSLLPMPRPARPGPYPEIMWRTPYSAADMLGGIPLAIDVRKGMMTATPNRVGNFVVGVCVAEYRKGVLLSITRRDFQYNVADCGRPEATFILPEALCDTRQLRFQNTGPTNRSYQWVFDWDGARTKTSTAFSPTYVFPDTGTYRVALIVNPRGPCGDTSVQTIRVTRTQVAATAMPHWGACTDKDIEIVTRNTSTDPVYGIRAWQWNLYGSNGNLLQQSSVASPIFSTAQRGVLRLVLVATGGNGCRDTVAFNLLSPYPNLQNWRTERVVCSGDSIMLYPEADPLFNYQWSPTTGLSDAQAPNPKAAPQAPTLYTVRIQNEHCTLTRAVAVDVATSGVVQAYADPPRVYKGEKTQLEAVANGAIRFRWTPAEGLSNAQVASPVATLVDSAKYTVVATFPNGCTAQATVRVGVLSPLCAEPYLFFPTGFTPNDDGQNDVLQLEGRFVEDVYWVVYNRWGEQMFEAHGLRDAWDGTYKGQPAPTEAYGYYLRVRCPNGEIFIKKGSVTLLR